ncbi:MAG TPA: MG2 domain-containing protein [Thermoanaerobaculia bacterium]|nr:MG2 domain-containing protein [Thermoanaerobaculia bacterium]
MSIFTLVVALLAQLALPVAPAQYDALKRDAEGYYAEKSFQRAHDLYAQAAQLDLPAGERRWVEMRLADTSWRADDSPPYQSSPRDRTLAVLEDLIRKSDDAHDRVWAEAHESLGDYNTVLLWPKNYAAALQHYTAALEWWAESRDLAVARARYLAIVFRFAETYPNLPTELLANALGVADAPRDRDRARLLLARRLLDERKPESVERGLEHLDILIREGRQGAYYDEALFAAAQQLSNGGGVIVVDGGGSGYRQDYVRALELYRRIVNEYGPRDSARYDVAKKAIEEITRRSVNVLVSSNFLPASEQQFILTWRNVKSIELAITAVDMVRDARPAANQPWKWEDVLNVEGQRVVRRWTFETNDRGDYAPGTEAMRIAPKLPPGAYIVSASGGGNAARQLLLVSETAIVTHNFGERLQIYVANVITGEPVAGARVRVLQNRGYQTYDAETNESGLADVTLRDHDAGSTLITAARGAQQAYEITNVYFQREQNRPEWRIYAFTDRPAFRPGETVHWKIIARTRQGGPEWQTPAGRTLNWSIVSPRNEKVASGVATLNAFGSFWSDLPVTAAMPLGHYRIEFSTDESEQSYAGAAHLFSIEEYKLPEFAVTVTTPEENGKKKQFRLGDTVEATVEAKYYFGGPVANATVEVAVNEYPYVRTWNPWHQYDWLYEPPRFPDDGGGSKQTSQTLRTDANGRAVVRIETSRDGGDKTFVIDASVTDASRREVSEVGEVAVMKQRYSVVAHPEHYVRLPNERASIVFNAADANNEPVQTSGTVTLYRRTWERGTYREELLSTTTLTTDANGTATFTFTPARVGYYTAKWSSEDRDPKRALQARDVVTAEGSVWVSERATRDVGYHSAGLDIIVDRDTFRVGETAAVLIATPASGRWVLVSTTTDRLESTQVLHLDGTVKLLQIPIEQRHVPNFFITVSSIFDRVLSADMKRIVVPPAERFVAVDVRADRDAYEPRQKGTVTVTTRDAAGNPVAAEVALSVADEAVSAIQQETAGDPRRYFYEDVRWMSATVYSSAMAQHYAKLVVNEKGMLAPEKEPGSKEAKAEATPDGLLLPYFDVDGGVAGGRQSVAESVTVTAESPAVDTLAAAALLKRGGGLEPIEVIVRSDFRSTAFWKPDLVTDTNGTATVSVDYPEALTTWRATARAVTAGTDVGMGSSTTRTNLPLIVRLQAPRFFVAGDRAVVSAVINNNSDAVMTIAPSLDAKEVVVTGGGAAAVEVPAKGSSRVDWTVLAERAGTATLRVTGRGATRGDAMEKTFPIFEHGIDKLVARSGKLRGAEAVVKLDLPRERRATELTVQIAPTLASTMLDALPYLLDYPYGCTEQTMSRFLPAAVVARTLRSLGREATPPVLRKIDDVTAASMARLYDFQHDDGGWGWWKEGGSDSFMTAYVVWGFSVAKEAGLPVKDAAVDNAVKYLENALGKSAGQYDNEAWMLHAVAAWRVAAHRSGNGGVARAFDDAWTHRDSLTSYSRALLTLAAHDLGDDERAKVLVRNLEDGVKIDRTPDQSVLVRGGSSTAETIATAHWGHDGFWWHWYDGPVESTAFALQAIVAVDPQNALVEPAMNWLFKNRRGARWNNTRDTAVALLALNDYLKRSGELSGDAGFTLSVNGHDVASATITAAEALDAPRRIAIDPALVRDGANEITIRRTSSAGSLYFAAEARFVSLEEPVKAAGNEIFVRREYFRLVPHPTLLKGVVYDKVPLLDGGTVDSGERIEVVATVDAKNDYDYLLFEDLKPAGFEAVALESGINLYAQDSAGTRSTWVYQELRDRKVAMFIDHLPQGLWEIRYTLRAEVPGSFHALPLLGEAIYVPEVRANGEEVRVEVAEGRR